MPHHSNESMQTIIKRRNEFLELLFADCNIPVRIIGDEHKPMIVYDERVFLSAWVRNFDLIFKPNSASSQEWRRIKLKKNHGISGVMLMDTIQMCEHRAVIKLCLNNDHKICHVGSDYRDRKNSTGRYPVFGEYRHKVYFDKTAAYVKCKELTETGYDVRVWVPAKDNTQGLKINYNGKLL